jgi:cyclophilin family peptidyl-prolyl cis-trans isomerase
VIEGMDVVKKIQASPTGTNGEYGTETIEPAIRILKAYRAKP